MRNKIIWFVSAIAGLLPAMLRQLRYWRDEVRMAANANSWPAQAGVTAGYNADGVTTIRWGTDGLLQSPRPASGFYTVIRFSQKQLSERIVLENGTGIPSTRILLLFGMQFDITVRDDTQMTPPRVTSTAVITDGAGILGTVGLVYTCKIIESSYDTAPKQAGERVLSAENLLLIDSQISGVPV